MEKAKLNLATLKKLRESVFFRELEDTMLEKANIGMVKERKVPGLTMFNGKPMKEFEIILDDGQFLSLFVSNTTGNIESVEIDGKAVFDFQDRTSKGIAKKIANAVIKRSMIKQKREIMRKVDISDKVQLGEQSEKFSQLQDLKKELKQKKQILKELKAKAGA